jgi:hypothetical protein
MYYIIYTGEDLKLRPVGVLCTAKRQIVTGTAHLKIENSTFSIFKCVNENDKKYREKHVALQLVFLIVKL